MFASVRSVSCATQSPTLRRTPTSPLALDAYRASAGVGLGISYNARDMGPLVPPPTPRLASSATLPEVPINQATVEEQVLNSMLTSNLYMRRRQARTHVTSTSTTTTSPRSPLAAHPRIASYLPATIPSSPTMSPFYALTLAALTIDGARRGENDVDRVGLGITGLYLSSPPIVPYDEDAEVIFEDDEWEYVKPAGFKSCKGRVCTPCVSLLRNGSWL